MRFRELEYKYDAHKVDLKTFESLMKRLRSKFEDKAIVKKIGSWDTYYTNPQGEFLRFRQNPHKPELTYKKKTSAKNNQNRIEINLPLAIGETKNLKKEMEHLEAVASAFVQYQGYTENFKIYKDCVIYFFGDLNFVYYIVYDEKMKERRRFIEIEFSEEAAFEKTEQEILQALDRCEQMLSPLGLTKRNRLRKSLFETFKKGD